jgi:tripartite-type tricarboxylate transporter receptor subunit TctC
MRTFCTSLQLIAVALATASPVALAQPAYPAKTVRMVVPFPPGGNNDIIARVVSVDLSRAMGQQFVVDNRGGASGIIGADIVAKSPPDGYTILVHSATHLTNYFSYKKLPYDIFRDFEAIAPLAVQRNVLVVHPSLPVKSVKDFIALAKAQPNQLAYASNGEGGNPHVLMALFASMANINMLHVPYKGGGPMATSLISGETQCAMASASSVMPLIKVGRVKALGVTAPKRTLILPDVPTISESGLPGYSMEGWVGAFAPANTPKPIIERLNAEINKVLKKPEFAKLMLDQGVESWAGSQQELLTQIKSDFEKYQKVFAIIGSPRN